MYQIRVADETHYFSDEQSTQTMPFMSRKGMEDK